MTTVAPRPVQLIQRYGAREVAEVTTPEPHATVMPELLLAVATETPMDALRDEWLPEDIEVAHLALARINDGIARAMAELTFYLRYRSPEDEMPAWVADDLLEMARYHLYDENGNKDSTVRLRYDDVIRRLSQLASDDAERSGTEGGTQGGVEATGQPRLFSRRSLDRL